MCERGPGITSKICFASQKKTLHRARDCVNDKFFLCTAVEIKIFLYAVSPPRARSASVSLCFPCHNLVGGSVQKECKLVGEGGIRVYINNEWIKQV